MVLHQENLRLGLIQTTTDFRLAWNSGLQMSGLEEEWAIAEIQQHMTALMQENPRPHIVLLPEVAIPHGFLWQLRRMAMDMNAIVIGGMDFQPASMPENSIVNRAAVIIPDGWGTRTRSSATALRFVGKTYPAAFEKAKLAEFGKTFKEAPQVWVFQTPSLGRFAVAICYDFLDLERVAMYRSNIQHLFILAYNPDLRSFEHAAEALSRMIFCNVVICNAGHYGGSLAVSPFYKPEKRTIYHHQGNQLSTSQMIDLPVADLILAQSNNWPAHRDREFKGLPPGAIDPQALEAQSDNLLDIDGED